MLDEGRELLCGVEVAAPDRDNDAGFFVPPDVHFDRHAVLGDRGVSCRRPHDGLADDQARVSKLLSKRHRDLGRLKNKASNRLHALLFEMVPGGASFRITTVTRVNAVIDDVEPADAMDGSNAVFRWRIGGAWRRIDRVCRPVGHGDVVVVCE